MAKQGWLQNTLAIANTVEGGVTAGAAAKKAWS